MASRQTVAVLCVRRAGVDCLWEHDGARFSIRLADAAHLDRGCSEQRLQQVPGALFFTWNNNASLQSVAQYYGNTPTPWGSLPSFNQSYGYDNLNRLSSASDSGGWSRSFGYDRYGNMWVTGNSGIGLAGNTPTSNVFNGANRMTGASYDNAGNQTVVNGQTMAYDAENRQIAATDPPSLGNGTENYLYDGAGQRVEKSGAAGTAVYVYDALGRMVGEYGASGASSPCATCYLTWDHLGTTRLVTDQNANVIARHDYLPFGEEIAANTAGRGEQWGPLVDNIEQKFTGQMRDQETGADFFKARYYGAALGRFTSPDPGNAGADLSNPQSWNGYAYALNNPLVNIDPSGRTVTCSTDANGNFSCYDDDPQPGGGDDGGDASPDLESICWWCWEYGYPYTGSQQPPPPPQKPQQSSVQQPQRTGTFSVAQRTSLVDTA